MRITLAWAEVATAARVGEARCIRNRANGSSHRYGKAAGADWSGDIEAAAAEMAAAKATGRYWPIIAEPDDWGDLGYGLHVRHTERPGGRLILHPDDPDDHFFILVTGSLPSFVVVGYLLAGAGKVEGNWEDPSDADRPAFFVAQRELDPIDDLIAPRPVPEPDAWLDPFTPPRGTT